ncbi:MAG: PQQ-dependent sugar dehydrogenase [Thermoanaerobaculia bacterium]|nr:PQQ-dependent sugar dehydrogenase [Thermoanaerobaculia bacterium]
MPTLPLILLPLLLSLLPPAAGAQSVRVATVSNPVFVAAPPDDPRLFIVGRAGRIHIWDGVQILDPPFLDISGRVDDGGSEGGLLGLAFPDDYAQSGSFYVYYTTTGPNGSNPLTSRISRFRVSAGDPDLADSVEKVLLEQDQPYANHNGGTLAFDLDGLLYFGFGDGGLGGDPLDAAQRGDTWLGKMLRLDVSHSSFFDDYGVPPDNPFVGVPSVLDEIWSLGWRNPFRFSFDPETGDLYVADVGQSEMEEVSVEPRPDPSGANPGGLNYGWDVMEGTLCFSNVPPPGDPDPDAFEPPCNAPELVLPVHAYPHLPSRRSITGGVVSRGGSLFGQYLFADFVSGEIWSFEWDGTGGTVGPVVDRTDELRPDVGSIDQPVGFGQTSDGSVYLADLDGEVFRLVPEPGHLALWTVGAGVLALARARRRD